MFHPITENDFRRLSTILKIRRYNSLPGKSKGIKNIKADWRWSECLRVLVCQNKESNNLRYEGQLKNAMLAEDIFIDHIYFLI